MNIEKIKFFRKNWKLGIHFIFRTKVFGVNNEWWGAGGSIFGWPWYKILWGIIAVRPIIDNYRGIKFRAVGCYFLSDKTNKMLGWK